MQLFMPQFFQEYAPKFSFMVHLAQMECFHPAGKMDDAHLLSVWLARLVKKKRKKEAELQAEAANVKLLSNRRLILVDPQKKTPSPT